MADFSILTHSFIEYTAKCLCENSIAECMESHSIIVCPSIKNLWSVILSVTH